MLDLNNFFFIVFSVFAVVTSLCVIFTKNPIYSVLYLILTMFCLSGHYILLQAQFLSIINIIVYAGAIMVLFLFVLMLLNLGRNAEPHKSLDWKLISIAIGVMMFLIFLVIYKITPQAHSAVMPNLPPTFGEAKSLGYLLFTKYVFAFEISSILFLAAIVGIVYLGENKKPINIKS